MNPLDHRRSQRVAAYFCLLAVLWLHAPMVLAAWPAHTSACCAARQCPAHALGSPAAPGESMPMDCGHGIGHMKSCSFSCCQPEVQALASPHIYVLPRMSVLPGPTETFRPLVDATSSEILYFPDPAYPPPRATA